MATALAMNWSNLTDLSDIDLDQQSQARIGDTFSIVFTCATASPPNVTTWSLSALIAPSVDSAPSKTWTDSSFNTKTSGGLFTLSAITADTSSLPGRSYYIRVKRVDSGNNLTIAEGFITLEPSPDYTPVTPPSGILTTGVGGTGSDMSAYGPGVVAQLTAGANLTTITSSLTGSKYLRDDLTWATLSVGTVTSVSITTANGVSGTVATATTTPAITLTLGAITPSSVAASGTVTGSNLSGTNTGDQTNISGNAATVSVIDAGSDTTCWFLFGTSQTGNLSPATNANATFNAATGMATFASPVFTGTPTAPTATVGTNTTQVATCAFVLANSGTAVTVANEATDTTCFPGFFTAATGNLGPKTNAGLTFNSATAILSATGFSGPLTGNVTGNLIGNVTGNADTATAATNATNTAITNDTTTNATMYPTWVTANTGNLPQKVSSTKFTFNPSTGNVTAVQFTGALVGNADTATTAGSASSVALGGITGLGTGVATALAANVGSAGAPVTFNGALGTPSSGTATNLAGSSGITGLGAQTQALNMGSHLINNVTDPSSAQDAATKNYVDAVATGLDPKNSVQLATTANITLSGEQTIDGVTTSASRVLVKNQSTASQNGLYLSSSGAWSRTTDADTSAEVTSGLFVFVTDGTITTGNKSTGWVLTTPDPITLGSTSLTFTQFSGAGTYTATGGITLTGSQFSITTAGITNAMLAGLIAASKLVGTDIATLGTVTAGTIALATVVLTGQVPTANGGTGVDNSTGGTANTFWARPNGSTGAATYRAIVVADITGLGTGVATALAVNVGSAGAFVTFNGALGTPSSGTLTNCTFPTLNQNTSGSAASLSVSGQTGLMTVTGLASTNRIKTVRDAADTILELGGSYTPTGTWTSMTFVTPALGTPASGTLTNCTGLPVAGITASTSTALGVGSLEVGNASDTTLSRSAGGLLAVEGNVIPHVAYAPTWTAAHTFTASGPQIILGVNTTTLGSMKLYGSTSGDVTIKPAAVAGTSTVFQLPASNGTSGYFLQNLGGGVTSWAAATTAGAVAVLFSDYTTISTTHNGSEDDLYSHTIPAGKLAANGDSIRQVEFIQLSVSATSANVNKYFGGVNFWGISVTITGDNYFILETLITRVTSTTIRFRTTIIGPQGVDIAAYPSINLIADFGSFNLATTNILKTTGISTGSTDGVYEYSSKVYYEPAS